MTIASATFALPGANATHDVRPMNGCSFDPSTATSTSLRGNDAFTEPSALFSGFSTPVAVATAPSSIGAESATAAAGWAGAAAGVGAAAAAAADGGEGGAGGDGA